MALVQRQPNVHQIAQKVHELLPGGLDPFDHLKGGSRREHRLDRPDEHHHHHHDGKDTDRIAGHVHYQQVHRELLDRSQRNVPGLFQDQVALVVIPGHFTVGLPGRWVESRWRCDITAAAGPVSVREKECKSGCELGKSEREKITLPGSEVQLPFEFFVGHFGGHCEADGRCD